MWGNGWPTCFTPATYSLTGSRRLEGPLVSPSREPGLPKNVCALTYFFPRPFFAFSSDFLSFPFPPLCIHSSFVSYFDLSLLSTPLALDPSLQFAYQGTHWPSFPQPFLAGFAKTKFIFPISLALLLRTLHSSVLFATSFMLRTQKRPEQGLHRARSLTLSRAVSGKREGRARVRHSLSRRAQAHSTVG